MYAYGKSPVPVPGDGFVALDRGHPESPVDEVAVLIGEPAGHSAPPGVRTIVAVVNALNPDTTATSSGPVIKPFLAARPKRATWSPSGVHGAPGTCQHSPQLAWRAAAQISASGRKLVPRPAAGVLRTAAGRFVMGSGPESGHD